MLEKFYFSPRQSSERQRICGRIKKDEEVLVMFSGAGPYVIEIAKNTSAKKVIGIEANRSAHKYAVENATINKVEDRVSFVCGSVEKMMPRMRKKIRQNNNASSKRSIQIPSFGVEKNKKKRNNTLLRFSSFRRNKEKNKGKNRRSFRKKRIKKLGFLDG